MRDTRNIKSIKSALDEYAEAIPEARDAIFNSNDTEVIEGLSFLLIQFEVNQCIAAYSAGLSKEKFQLLVLELIGDFSSHFEMDRAYYDYVCDVVALAVLAGVETEDFKRITMVLKKYNVQDKLLNLLVSSIDTDWTDNSTDFIQKKPYSKLNQAINELDETTGVKEVATYLRSWYKENKDAPWHDTHLLENGNAYVGYWCWEAAALVKAKGWNDDKLKDSEHYPYDAVHW